jgi:hypothetical protein
MARSSSNRVKRSTGTTLARTTIRP